MAYFFMLACLILVFLRTFWPLLVLLIIVMIGISIKQNREADEHYEKTYAHIFSGPLPTPKVFSEYSFEFPYDMSECSTLISPLNELFKQWYDIKALNETIKFYESRLSTYRSYIRSEDLLKIANKIKDLEKQKYDVCSSISATSIPCLPGIENDTVLFRSMIAKLNDVMKTEAGEIETFHQDNCAIVYENDHYYMLLLPQFFVNIFPDKKIAHVKKYNEVSVENTTSTRLVSSLGADDDLAEITYRYTRKDGERDLRYSYENNPKYYYIYTGILRLSTSVSSINLSYHNKTKSKEAYEAFRQYKENVLYGPKTVVRPTKPSVSEVKNESLHHTKTEVKVRLGMHVKHHTFGRGVIINVIQPHYADIKFENCEKRFTFSSIQDSRFFEHLK